MEVSPGDGVTLGSTLLTIQRAAEEKEPASTKMMIRAPAPIVNSRIMQQLYKTVDRIAQSAINVLLLGETGVGKEVMAEALHQRSPRLKKPLVCLNCAAFSEQLLESELFGHEAGAFTGAAKAKPGLLEVADGGTVFLDEVGELPMALQVKLLRVLEERKVRRVGGLTSHPINVRFVSATNRNLDIEVQRGAFRQDLFFRLNGISLTIPPLRERREEIEAFAARFIARASEQARLRVEPVLSPWALEALKRHSWPGNIRELRNVVERAVVLCQGDVISHEHLGLERESDVGLVRDGISMRATLPPPMSAPAIEGDPQRRRITEALERCAGNQTQAAQMLGMSRRTLVSRLDDFGIARPRKKT
jgi:DNA-binding NtrC family response regulator